MSVCKRSLIAKTQVRLEASILEVAHSGFPNYTINLFLRDVVLLLCIYMDNGSVLTACSTTCRSVTHSDRNTCFGSGCCQTPIPNSLKSFSINITGLDGGDGACRSAFLVEDETLYEKAMFSDPLFFKNSSVIPIALKWTLTASDQVTCCYNQPPQRDIMDMINGSTMEAWRCYDQWSSDGNPYLIDGCFGGQGDHAEECKRCEDSGGYCQRARMYDIDGSEVSQTFTCHHYNKTSLGLILVEI
ncbi:wall-associated receptor kinase 4 isoform X1 [Helianthus annuus]|uniref:wall-associated receptor kinase 4 isoform X1 n=1 Tax=Helianthus annuus TaxID=4232 RepID=UPI0016531EAE|nr:wall-associated receptor kinase 4 isoform X1 [Helianthus annuus]